MINPMMQNLNQNKIIQMVQTIKAMKNPEMMIKQMPQYKEIENLIKENGGDAKSAFYNLANQMGIDPDEIINLF